MHRPPSYLLVYLTWLVLAALAGWIAWTLYGLLMLGAVLWLNSDLPRPPGWTPGTAVGISKMLVLGLGAVWLGYILWMEREMDLAARRRTARRRASTLAGVMVGVLAGLYALSILVVSIV